MKNETTKHAKGQIELSLSDGSGNRYRIVEERERHMLIECVWFCGAEDLGDRIFCNYEGQRIYVAKYHSDHYVRHEL